MRATSLQSLLAVNASRISSINIQIGFQQDQAANYKNKGETSLMIDAYKALRRERRKLAKVASVQNELKTELLAIHRAARIVSKTALLAKYGVTFVACPLLTSFETENALNVSIKANVPKKPDSRLKAA